MLKRPLFVLFLLALKNDFASKMYLRIKGKWQWVGVLVLMAGLAGILIYHLITQEDKITVMHIFNYSGWGAMTGEYVISFIRNDMIVLFFVGCMNQALKEKTGTIWIPVLLHAAWDFALAYN